MKTYHFGLLKKSKKTLILQISESVDGLSCEIWKYLGQRVNSITNIKKVRKELLVEINKNFGTNYKHLLIEA